MAEELDWQTGSGVDIVAENCVGDFLASAPYYTSLIASFRQFEQAEFWLGMTVTAKDREAIRQAVRDHL